MKAIKVKLNSATNEYQQLGILLVANRMVNEYKNSLQRFPGIGPEAFAESWIKTYITRGNKVFKDDVIRVFISMLIGIENNA